jgi:cytochrome c oxidase assembly protein Cox11
MRYSTDPRKQRKQQKYIAIFLAIFAALFVISYMLCKFYNLFCAKKISIFAL